MTATELRRDKRIPLLLEVRLDSLSGNHTARTGDISLGGCYIETIAQVVAGERISFAVLLPTGRWIVLSGKVAYHLPHMGFGIQFTDMRETERNLLSQLIEFASHV